MSLRFAGGLAALTCAATYLVGFALLTTVLAPLGYGTDSIDAMAVARFIAEQPGLLIIWNSTIYIANALALIVLCVALRQEIGRASPDAAALTGAFGLVWAMLVLAAGMIANVAIERTHALAADPEAAAALWKILQAVELGLGGGNEIAGGVWILAVGLAGHRSGMFGPVLATIATVTGLAGLVTLVPQAGEIAGAVFGLGAMIWFVGMSATLLRGTRPVLHPA